MNRIEDYPEQEIQSIVENAKGDILQDIKDGTVPKIPENFEELHNYVDANYYGGFLEDHYEVSEDCKLENEVQARLDKWIKKGLVEHLCDSFFRELIEATGTYFLSDYVETEIYDYIDEDTANDYVTRLNQLKLRCKEDGINIHQISCNVADELVNG